jgi:cell division protein FtsZ
VSAPQRTAATAVPAAPQAQPVPEMRMEPQPTRMPRVEDFPPVVKAEMEHRAAPHGQTRRSRSDGIAQADVEFARTPRRRRGLADAGRRPGAAGAASALAEASVYAPRRGQLDDQGRVTPQARTAHEDEQLEIPAFLRRQAK